MKYEGQNENINLWLNKRGPSSKLFWLVSFLISLFYFKRKKNNSLQTSFIVVKCNTYFLKFIFSFKLLTIYNFFFYLSIAQSLVWVWFGTVKQTLNFGCCRLMRTDFNPKWNCQPFDRLQFKSLSIRITSRVSFKIHLILEFIYTQIKRSPLQFRCECVVQLSLCFVLCLWF